MVRFSPAETYQHIGEQDGYEYKKYHPNKICRVWVGDVSDTNLLAGIINRIIGQAKDFRVSQLSSHHSQNCYHTSSKGDERWLLREKLKAEAEVDHYVYGIDISSTFQVEDKAMVIISIL